jgi:hypothetical protein
MTGNEWISCSEQMPVQNRSVAVLAHNLKTGDYFATVDWLQEDNVWHTAVNYWSISIEYWYPLPDMSFALKKEKT